MVMIFVLLMQLSARMTYGMNVAGQKQVVSFFQNKSTLILDVQLYLRVSNMFDEASINWAWDAMAGQPTSAWMPGQVSYVA